MPDGDVRCHLLRPRLSDEVRGTVSPMTERGRASQLKHLQQTSAKPFRRCWKMQSLPQSPTLMKKSGSRWKKHPSSRQRYCSSAYSCAPGLVRNRRSYVTLPEDTVFSSASCMHLLCLAPTWTHNASCNANVAIHSAWRSRFMSHMVLCTRNPAQTTWNLYFGPRLRQITLQRNLRRTW